MFKLITIFAFASYTCSCAAEALTADQSQHVNFLTPRYNITGPGPQDYECISARSPDYYGVGVRLGLYFSWWTSWAANAGMPDEIGTALDQNTVFLFATLVALVRCTITFVLTQLDALILMHLAMGTVIGVMSSFGYRTCYYHREGVRAIKNFGGVGTHLRLLCNLGVCIYGIWYWVDGVRPGYPDLENDTGSCRTVWTFMFGKIDAAGPIRKFYIFFGILGAVYFGVVLFVAPFAAWVRVRTVSKSSIAIQGGLPKELQLATGLDYKQLTITFRTFQILTAFWLFWSMLTIEMTLTYNHVKSVLGPGGRIYFPSQLIPMILGGFTFTRLVWKRFVQSRFGGSYVNQAILGHDDDNDAIKCPTNQPSSPSPPTKSQQESTSTTLIKLMTPANTAAKDKNSRKFNDDDIDGRMLDVSTSWRVLVTFLPWLSLLSRFRSSAHYNSQSTEDQSYENQSKVENPNIWDHDTPSTSPDPRSGGVFRIRDQRNRTHGDGSSAASRGRTEYQIGEFRNTIS